MYEKHSMYEKPRYLNAISGAPDGFEKTFVMLLKLDDGSELPAHSQILARFSTLFTDMLVDGPLVDASPLKKAYVPLTECERETAVSLLSVIYSDQHAGRSQHVTTYSCMAIASLAHKLCMKV